MRSQGNHGCRSSRALGWAHGVILSISDNTSQPCSPPMRPVPAGAPTPSLGAQALAAPWAQTGRTLAPQLSLHVSGTEQGLLPGCSSGAHSFLCPCCAVPWGLQVLGKDPCYTGSDKNQPTPIPWVVGWVRTIPAFPSWLAAEPLAPAKDEGCRLLQGRSLRNLRAPRTAKGTWGWGELECKDTVVGWLYIGIYLWHLCCSLQSSPWF